MTEGDRRWIKRHTEKQMKEYYKKYGKPKGVFMKPTDRQYNWADNKSFWREMFGKLRKLGTAIEMKLGSSMDIDNPDYRWVSDRIEYFDEKQRLLTKAEMDTANALWRKYS